MLSSGLTTRHEPRQWEQVHRHRIVQEVHFDLRSLLWPELIRRVVLHERRDISVGSALAWGEIAFREVCLPSIRVPAENDQ